MLKQTRNTNSNKKKVLSMPMQMGGVGKSRLTDLLNHYIANERSVVVVDCDQQKNLSSSFLRMDPMQNFKSGEPSTDPE